MGLAITKQLVLAMGGEIGCNSTLNKGSTFWFTVRLDQATEAGNHRSADRVPVAGMLTNAGTLPQEAESTERGHSLPTAARPLRLLLAEDNVVNQQVALHQLNLMGRQVEIANNGLEALELMNRNVYDAVLMDVHMPGLDGYATTREIRKREAETKHTWIIAMTANALPTDRAKCLAAGMDDYLSKPVSSATLAQVLARCPSNGGPTAWSVDLRFLLESGMADILPEIIEAFVETSSQTMEKAERALAAQDAAGLCQCVHSLKGSAASLGAKTLVDFCGRLEGHCLSGPLEPAPALLAAIHQELTNVRQDLFEYREQPGKAPSIPH